MRTYSHAILTYAALRLTNHTQKEAALGAIGATLPDLPAGIGAAWLWTKNHSANRKDFDHEVCGRNAFRVPDAAAHSLPVLMAAVLLCGRESAAVRSLLYGWAGHLAADFLTHSSDARPQMWPLTEWRFRSPVSYRERERHGRAVTVLEHSLVVAAVISKLAAAYNNLDTEGRFS